MINVELVEKVRGQLTDKQQFVSDERIIKRIRHARDLYGKQALLCCNNIKQWFCYVTPNGNVIQKTNTIIKK